MWIHDPMEIVSLDIVPDKHDTCSSLVNKLTRMLLIVILIMCCYSYSLKHISYVIGVGTILILFIYIWMTNKKENFSHVPLKMDLFNSVPVSAIPSYPPPPSSQSIPPNPFPVQSQVFTPNYQPPQHYQQPPPPQHLQQSPNPHVQELLRPVQKQEGYTPLDVFFKEESKPVLKDLDFYTPVMKQNSRMDNKKVILAPRIMDPQFSVSETSYFKQINEQPVSTLGGMGMPTYTPRKKKHNTSMLLEPTESEKTMFVPKPNRIFLQDIEPHIYSITNDTTPVNANLGISSTPQIPELSKQTIMGDDGKIYPLYSRIDPELIRDDVTDERKREMPKRNSWSEELPSSNPLNTTTLYDPRFTGYGDSARAYYDSEMGNVRYYYTDVDAYRSPNFVIRNKVDQVDFVEPTGNVSSMYLRTAALDDVSEQVHDDWMSRSTEFREDIMERLMRKQNAMNWQMRFAPKSKGARLSSFTSSY